MSAPLYLEPRQSSARASTSWENDFGDVIEAAFTAGARDVAALVGALNASRVRPREGGDWTAAAFETTVAELGA